ncbi:cytochrome P450 [Acephala macrosclerotiorum]|nr:cytochrome P450 [Acephala macrosclerotiorum]
MAVIEHLLRGREYLSYFTPEHPLRTLAIVLCIGHIVWYLTKLFLDYSVDIKFARQHGCKPAPELPKKWPLGLDRIVQIWEANADGRLLEFFCDVAKDYEPRNMVSQYFLFGPRSHHVLIPDDIESILSTNFIGYSFGVRPHVFKPLLGSGIFTQEGTAWKHSRELLRKQFVRAQYQNLDQFKEHVDNLINCLPDEGVVDMQPLFFNLTLDTATALLFGKSVYSLRADLDQEKENRYFSENFNTAQEGLAKRFRIAPWHFFYNPAHFRRACSNVHQFIERYIQQRNLEFKTEEDGSDGSYGFIDQVARESHGMEDLRDQLLNVLLAGRDTTACCLSWTIYLIVRHDSVMECLRAEIETTVGDSSDLTREQIMKMRYLGFVIKESLRLYPPVPLNIREARQTTFLPMGGGPDGHDPVLVRKGEVVVVSQYITSRKKNIYGPDAEDFRPERWEGDKLAKIGWAYFPFSGGPRHCLGEDFALMEVSYTIVRLLQTFRRITLPEPHKAQRVGKERQRLTLVLSSEDGCMVKLQR